MYPSLSLSKIVLALASRKWLKFHASPGENSGGGSIVSFYCVVVFISAFPFPSSPPLYSLAEENMSAGKTAGEKK